MIELTPGKLWGMRRMADAAGFFKMTAVDQRPPIKGPIAKYYGTAEAPYDDVAGFKALLIETLQSEASAMLLDPHFAIPRGTSDGARPLCRRTVYRNLHRYATGGGGRS